MIESEVWRAGLGPCVRCGSRLSVDGHHVIPKRVLRRLGFHDRLLDTRNRLALCRRDHERHENRSEPVTRELLPASVFEFADELRLGWYLDRHYPYGSPEAVTSEDVSPTERAEASGV